MIRRFLTLILAWILALSVLAIGWWLAASAFPNTPIESGFLNMREWITPLLAKI